MAGTLVANCSTIAVSGINNTLNDTIFCPQFDSGLGALQSIQITINGSSDETLGITNHNGVDEIVTIAGEEDFTVSAIPGFTFPSALFSALNTITPFVPGDNVTHDYSYSVSGSGDLGMNTTSLASYIGSGTFGIGVSAANNTTVSGKAVGSFPVAAATSATAAVTYTFTPEPASFLLAGCSLAALALVLRIRRA